MELTASPGFPFSPGGPAVPGMPYNESNLQCVITSNIAKKAFHMYVSAKYSKNGFSGLFRAKNICGFQNPKTEM